MYLILFFAACLVLLASLELRLSCVVLAFSHPTLPFKQILFAGLPMVLAHAEVVRNHFCFETAKVDARTRRRSADSVVITEFDKAGDVQDMAFDC